MELKNEAILDDRDNHFMQENSRKPEAYRVDDDNNIKENDLERSWFTRNSDKHKPVMEGKGMGGENFGKNNLTPAGDDKNNPSQNAGYSNAYFARTEPSEEHPEYSNFTAKNQDGVPDYSKAQLNIYIKNEVPKPEKVERGNGENDRPHTQQYYEKENGDTENVNIPGPNELPDQQKVGEDSDDEYEEKDHIET
jgi:hypothetical protein